METEEGITTDVEKEKMELCCSDRGQESYGLSLQMMNAVSNKWTDEKHSLFLNSIEASFIDQLYSNNDLRPKGLLGQSPRAHKQLSSALSCAGDPSHSQVRHWGNWGRLHYEEGKCQADIKKEAHILSKNQWVRHFRSSNRKEEGKEGSMKMEPSALYHHICRLDSVASSSEVSDQNFTDEEVERLSCRRKRVRTSFTNGEFRDQVVPSGLPSNKPNSEEPQSDNSCVNREDEKSRNIKH